MKKFFKDILADKTIVIAFFVNIFFVLTSVIYVLIFYGTLPPLIPVFNQMPWGEQRLGSQMTIFIPIGISSLIFAINLFMSALIYKNIPLIARMLAAMSLLMGILAFLFVIRIITLII